MYACCEGLGLGMCHAISLVHLARPCSDLMCYGALRVSFAISSCNVRTFDPLAAPSSDKFLKRREQMHPTAGNTRVSVLASALLRCCGGCNRKCGASYIKICGDCRPHSLSPNETSKPRASIFFLTDQLLFFCLPLFPAGRLCLAWPVEYFVVV